MKVYHYDPETGEVARDKDTGAVLCVDAAVVPSREDWPDSDPRKFMVPAYSTTIKPPRLMAGRTACFLDEWAVPRGGVNTPGAWVTMPTLTEHGTAYSKATGTAYPISFPGELPIGLTLKAPPSPHYNWDDDLDDWVEDTRARRFEEIPWGLSRSQFLIGLKKRGTITAAEALAVAKGDIPTAITAAIETLPADERDDALIEFMFGTDVGRESKIIEALGFGEEDGDQFFVENSTI